MDEQQFNKKYWYGPLQIITVSNPTTEDFTFQAVVETGVDMATGKPRAEQRSYRVRAGSHERLPGTIANLYLDQMAKIMAQNEEKFQFMIDFALKEQYFQRLIVDTEDLITAYQPMPQYLEKPETEETKPEVPFAGVKEQDVDQQGDSAEPEAGGAATSKPASKSK